MTYDLLCVLARLGVRDQDIIPYGWLTVLVM